MRQSPAATAAEVKISFAGGEAGAVFGALALDREQGRARVIHFWDKPKTAAGAGVSLPLLEQGLILRLRRDEDGPGSKRKADLTVKLRPCPPLPASWQKEREEEDWEFRAEEDRAGPSFTPVLSASLEAERGFATALEAERGGLDGVLIEPQLELLDGARAAVDDLDGLLALGPVRAVKWKQDWAALPGSVAIEEWTVGDELRFLEVSVRVDLEDAAGVQSLLAQALRDRGLTLPQTGETKTRTVLVALARDLLR
ncbi:hypothetical protein ACFYZT_10180 [Streptomyces sp. NPDC001591]|uniref:hypothetical protein n=1 Tax=Streptomyces sp. NPDC001591 TaxID=3364589 RepID=UPI0036B42D26